MYSKKYNFLNYTGKMDGGLSPKRYNIGISEMYFYGVYSRETEVS